MLEYFFTETWRYIIAIAAAGVGGLIIALARQAWATLQEIRSEFRPNGGGSMRDQVVQIKQMVWSMSARMRASYEGEGDPMWESDANGNCVWANRALLHLVVRSFDDMRGSGWENIVHPSDRERIWREWVDAIEHNRGFESNYRVISTAGQVYSVDALATPIVDGDTISGWIGRYRRVTPVKARRRA